MALQPSAIGQDFAAADLKYAAIGPEEAGRILLQYMQQGEQPDAPTDTLTALLAALLKSQAPGNVRFVVTPYFLGQVGLGPARIQQILLENPVRNSLSLMRLNGGGVDGTTYFLFETGPLSPTNMTTPDFNAKTKFALSNAAPPIQYFPSPINPVTIMVAADSFTRGVIIEGI